MARQATTFVRSVFDTITAPASRQRSIHRDVAAGMPRVEEQERRYLHQAALFLSQR